MYGQTNIKFTDKHVFFKGYAGFPLLLLFFFHFYNYNVYVTV